MMIETTAGHPIEAKTLHNYFKKLVNNFFKILPMRENEEPSLQTYMCSLQIELIGCKEFVNVIKDNPSYLTLLAILQYLIDTPGCSILEVKREVFKAISICNQFQSLFIEEASA